jgi:preprotein translocase subunit SecA
MQDLTTNLFLDSVKKGIVENAKKHKKEKHTYQITQQDQKITEIKKQYKKDNNKKLGRNAPCPCGSGKKFKNCCGKE